MTTRGFESFNLFPSLSINNWKEDKEEFIIAVKDLSRTAIEEPLRSHILKTVEVVNSRPIEPVRWVMIHLTEFFTTEAELVSYCKEIMEFAPPKRYWNSLYQYPDYLKGEIWAGIQNNGDFPQYFNPRWLERGQREKVLQQWYAVAKVQVGYNRLEISLVGGRTEEFCPRVLFEFLLKCLKFEEKERGRNTKIWPPEQ